MKLDMVGRTASELLALQRDILQRLSGDHGDLWYQRYVRMHQGENPFAELVAQSPAPDTWKDELVASARRKLKKFFGTKVPILPIPASWTPEFLTAAAVYNMRPVFLPKSDISETYRRKGYIRLGDWYYANVKSGVIKGKHPTLLPGCWCLADFTVGVDYTDGTQVFVNDPWAPVIKELRDRKIVDKYNETPIGSRFAITWDEWNQYVLGYMASKLGVTRAQISLEQAVEFNAIGNIYDSSRGRFNCWEWFQDQLEVSRALCGGNRGNGGLACVSYDWRGNRYRFIAARPLVRFVQ